uniref:NEDD8 ultimate buster 1 ubiquitin-like domain-containing protein n=1 Tax=Equus caballus TaxID=9796 RepID=A0A9L0S0Y1_HORSE
MWKKNIQAKLTQLVRKERRQLWKPPYTDENNEGGLVLKALAKKDSDKTECCGNEIEKIREEICCNTVEREKGNENDKTAGIAAVEVFLPPRLRKDRKNFLKTQLYIPGRELSSKNINSSKVMGYSTHPAKQGPLSGQQEWRCSPEDSSH